MTPLLQLRDVCHAYGEGENRQPVLHHVSFTLAAGEFTALVGQSGSGKSTLLNQVGLLEHAASGSIRLNGREVTTLDDDARTRLRNEQLGFIFQFHHLLNAFTALENVMVPLKIRGQPEKALRERARSLLDRAGLSGLENRFPNQLSGGQQQRVAIVRALMAGPALVLADEPTGNLDSETTGRIFELLRQINREDGTAFLIVTHDDGLAAACDRRLTLKDGRLTGDSAAAP
ncbi:lipoprotein-releasing system ATP-binding protein [Fluviicoccus keumensis]|uniref:Lipoprotein-releasing system ATP-binding protein n=1 Tax=Fluviicoccus keumensis TaxID=1435465 RepID=A0A4Q7ZDN0_9GAMM|nr:ABC transporter ATP-binding protein [Fluviicoccus keumensis]RZU48009.1 lipoprotein-releasing system ATP-binding protein [Fluviicoccus keumensis]